MFVVGQNKHRSKADPQIDKNRWAQFVVGQREATLLNSSPDLLLTILQYHHILIIVIIRDRLVTVIL